MLGDHRVGFSMGLLQRVVDNNVLRGVRAGVDSWVHGGGGSDDRAAAPERRRRDHKSEPAGW